MKFKLFCFLSIILSNYVSSQSIPSELLVSYARFQNIKIIKSDLDYKGFITKLGDNNQLVGLKSYDSENASEVIYATFNYKNATFTVCNTSMYFNEKKNYFLSKNLIFRYKDKQTGTLVYDHPSEKYNVGIQEEEMIVCIFTGL